MDELEKGFHSQVDDYLGTCKKLGKEPGKEFSGSFNVRVKPNVHKLAAIRSSELNISLNKFVEKAVESAVSVSISESKIVISAEPLLTYQGSGVIKKKGSNNIAVKSVKPSIKKEPLVKNKDSRNQKQRKHS